MTQAHSEDILSNYGKDLQVLDMLNWIQDSKDSWGSPTPLALDSSTEKNDEHLLD
jgi:hypothetical protein